MSIVPEPSISRGEITLQPNYFSSSLYVDPLRKDISALIVAFSEHLGGSVRPFELFKKLWMEQGWSWLHLRVHDGRARQAFLRITERLFIERLTGSESPLTRVIALFSLYTFHATQPYSSAPPIYSLPNIAIPIDTYQDMLAIPAALSEARFQTLKPYAIHILSTMLDAKVFHVMPHSLLNAQNPSNLPREVVVVSQEASAVYEASSAHTASSQPSTAPPKKKGRPSRRDKVRKAKEALLSLERYVDRNHVALPEQPALLQIDADLVIPDAEAGYTAHTLFGQAPTGSLENYFTRKNDLLTTIQSDSPDGSQKAALQRANEAVLARLKQIDEMAAEKGLEVGGEGGEKTGLTRVERAVDEFRRETGAGASGGVLGLLEGAGLDSTIPPG
ncbi:hypothetical protein BD414DRAFT_514295 [Trametes punicea]|nr:hypothetical protein BD414DRAFT_514295 [Trametes punicea]